MTFGEKIECYKRLSYNQLSRGHSRLIQQPSSLRSQLHTAFKCMLNFNHNKVLHDLNVKHVLEWIAEVQVETCFGEGWEQEEERAPCCRFSFVGLRQDQRLQSQFWSRKCPHRAVKQATGASNLQGRCGRSWETCPPGQLCTLLLSGLYPCGPCVPQGL